MEDQGKDGKIEADGEAATEDHSRNGHDQATGAKKNVKNEKRSKILSDSTYPSSTSYSTAEEGSSNGGGRLSNGDDVSSSIQNPKRNMSVEHLQAHIHHLEDLLAGKEAALIAITQELDAVREMSCIDASIGPLAVAGFDNDFKASISEYNRKLQEHASALCQRDEMIQKLAETLKQSVRDREELKIEAERLTSQVHSLQTQLHSVGQHVQNPQTKLLEALKEKESELQKKSVELSQCKAQSAKEVQFLMSSLEELQQRAARATSSSPPAPKTSDETERKLSRELKDLRKCYETDKKYFGDQLADAQKRESYLRAQVSAAQKECDKLNLDLSALKLAHETQLSVCKDHQGIAPSEHQKRLEVELRRIAELDNEIQLLRIQVSEKDKLSRKQGDRIQMLQSQVQEYATDITTCHQTLEQYKKRIDELQTKHSEEMAQRESSLHFQNTQLNQHISELQEAHSRQLQNMHQDLNKMKQRQMEELATIQLSHENEVNTSKRDAERFRNELREKNNVLAMQEEQLELERQWSRTYSQQVQELGEKLNKEEDKNEQYRGKIETLEQHLKELSEACKLYQPQIESLHQQLNDERKKSVLVMHQLEDLHKQLSLEQDKCKAHVTSLDLANSNIEELQSKNSELQIQVQKQDESSDEKIKLKEQENASLQKELVTISEKLKQEQIQASAFKEVIETLNQQVKIYAAQEKHLKETQAQLEYEKQSSEKSKSQIESLNLQLDSLKSKNINDCQKLDVELQKYQTNLKKLQEETEDLKKELCNVQEANRQEKARLEQQIKELTEGSRKSQADRDKLLAKVGSLESKHLNSSSPDLHMSTSPPVHSRISGLIASWTKKCEDLVQTNIELKSTVSMLQAELTEVKRGVSPNRDSTKSLGDILNQRCDCEKQFSEERNVLRNSIEILQKELTNKDLQIEEKIKNIFKKNKNPNQSDVDLDSFISLMNALSCKFKETTLLQNELTKVKLENKLLLLKEKNQKELCEKSQISMEKLCQEYYSLQNDLLKVQKENNVLQARLIRVQNLYESIKKRTAAPNDLLLRLIEELSLETTDAGSMYSSKDNAVKQSVMEKMKSVLSIIKKMNTDCEATLVKLQNDNNKSVLCGYLQSEALGLRRLESVLIEMHHSLASKCEPAMQLHVDVLSQQLEEKDSLYQEVCQSLYSLETEMREMEEKFQQQDEHLQERLRKQKSATLFWKLRAESAQAQILTLQLIDQNQENDLSGILSEMDSMYLQALGTFQDELERVTQLRENNVRLELSEKILLAQKIHKQQMEELGKQIRADSTVKALQVLHQEEIEAIRAECDYARFKAIKKLQLDLPSSLKLPRVQSSMPCTELSLLLMKHSISSRYNTAIRKVSTSVCNEVVRKLSLLEEQLGNASSNNDPNFEFVVPDSSNADSFGFFEQLIKNVKEWGDKILKMQTDGLQSVLSECEENHKLMTSKVQSLVNEFDGLCDVLTLQEQLVKLKEEHQLALGSLAASHKAEVSRLRLLLAQQGGTESSDMKETALSVLRKELEEKHKRQMEELRTYFEQKCADFEKHYSEEVFSQHSRKLSDCSSASESELVSEMYYAGPGSSSCSVQAAPSHFCDVLGESSFKDIEEQSRSGDLEKLFMENREQLETVRLALESRHQAELEAQKEHYEAKLEDLLRSLNECHTDELKLHNKCLKDMHDVEATLNKKLSEAEKEVSSLKELIMCEKGEIDSVKQSKDVNQHQRSVTELETELKKLNDILKQKELESASQIAALKRKLRLNDEVMSKLEKDISNLRSKYETDVLSLSSSVNEKVQEIRGLSSKIQELSSCLEDDRRLRQQAECEMENRCLKLKEEYENKLRIKHEEYEVRVADLVAQHVEELHKKDLEAGRILEEKLKKAVEDKKAQLEAEYSEYLEFVKKCADDTKLQLLQRQDDEIKLLTDKYERQFSNMREAYESDSLKERQISEDTEAAVRRPPSTLSNESFVKESVLCDCLQELIQLADKLSTNQQVHLENIIIKLCKEEERSQQKLHQDMEMRLHNVQSECERRFHLQLEEARGDIVKALEDQIQQLLDDNTGTVEKPFELQQLEKKFAAKYLQKLSDLQKEHDARISDLHQKHLTQLSLARSKIQSAQASPITHEELQKLYKERDCLRNVAATLRDVVAELVRYFMSWEDDFNNTLMDELVKLEGGRDNDILSVTHQENSFGIKQSPDTMQGDSSTSDDEMPVIVATPAKARCLSTSLKRVHFAPDISGILSFIEDGSILEGVGLNCSLRDASLNFQEELERCLVRLRSESAALYALSKPALPTSLSSVSEVDDKSDGKLSNRLSEALQNVAKLQKENEDLRNQLKELHEEHEMSYAELLSNRMRVETLEHEVRQQAEIVAEGYGEGDQSIACDLPGSPRATTVEELQSKARSLILGVSNPEEIPVVVSPNSSHHLPHVVEELCRDWERLAEESRHRQDDLQQQVEAADKQLRATRTFMDEQATEREQEREDFVQEIKRLQEILRDKDRDQTSQQQMNHEVEILEGQLKESQLALQDTQDRLEKLSAEHKQAVEKIWTLRDIISDLEVQVATKAEEAATAAAQNEALQTMVEQQGRTQLELAQEMEELQLCSGNGRLAEHITQLEDQLRKHQILAEQLGDPSAIDQMKVQLNDLGASLELHTKELECAHASVGLPASPCLSSPSEDVSIRETLEAIRAAAERKEESKQSSSCVILPFDEVSQVSEQWQRHARADDAVLKKLRDLDMQLDDVQAEKDTLAAQLQEQMLLSSSLQAKLDEHRRKADVKLSIATAEMQSEIEDLKSEILNYVDTLESREKQIESLRSSLHLIENDLRKREAEVQKSAEAERVIAAQLKIQVSKLSSDKEKLQALLSEKDAMHGSLPALVESMLLDKNADIDRLEKQVSHLTKQMDVSSHYVATPSTTLGFEYVESEKVRAHVELSPVLELRRSLNIPTIIEHSQPSHGFSNDTSLSLITRQMSFDNDAKMEPEAEVSLAPVPLEETVSQSQSVQNSNSGNVSDTLSSLTNTFDTSLSSCEKKVAALEEELEIKNKIITDYLNQIETNASIISELEQKCKHFEECERKITEMSNREEELKSLRDKLQVDTNVMRDEFEKMIQAKDLEIQHLKDQLSTLHASTSLPQDKQLADELEESSELEAKDSEIQRLRNEVSATQSTLANLQRKVQEAKQIARSPSRSSPDNNQALRIVQNELDVARQEIAELKELCKSIRSEVEAEYQQKQNEFDDMLSHEQQAKQSLLETLENLKQEIKMKELNNLEEQLKEAENKLIIKEEEAQKLHSELNQLNMECVTLKNQLSTPVSEVTLLKRRLDAEKKFADALKEELLTFKNKASTLEEECKLLRERTKDLQSNLNTSVVAQEEHSKLLEEVSDLKLSVHSSLREQNSYKKYIEKLSHENSVLKEENAEVGKELSDMKQVIIQMHAVKVSYEESEKNLQLKSNELNEVRMQMNTLSDNLSSLRRALTNIHNNSFDVPELAEDDRHILSKLQKMVIMSNLRGAGDGPWNKLSLTATDIHEISPGTPELKESESLDNLTGLVQHELDLSVQLDHSLLQTIDSRSNNKQSSSSSTITQGKSMLKTAVPCEMKIAGSQANVGCTQGDSSQHKTLELEKELSQMKTALQSLHDQLETERAQYCKLQQQDCDLIEEMRLKLSEALDGQAALRLQLQSELKKRKSSINDTDTKEVQGSTMLPKNELSASVIANKEKLQEQLNWATTELLQLRAEKDSMEKQLRRIQEVEIQRSRRRAVTEEKHRRHIDQLQSLNSETQQECLRLHEELAAAKQKLLLAHEEFAKDRDAQLKNHAPFVERLKNMNTFLEEHIEENVRMAKQMEELTEEHRKLRRKIAQLEGQLAEKRSNESFEAMSAHFSAERAEWESEQKLLLLALNKAKQNEMRTPDSDVEERVSHLFGRYLRMQSYRKALVWQKRYLLSVITGMNESKALTASHLAACGNNGREKQLNPRRKFRSAVMVTMAIHRMQFMVERWLRGKRIGCGVVVQQTFSQYTVASSSLPQGQQTIYPSSHLSTGQLRSGLLSQSPPTLERPRQPRSQPPPSSQFSRSPLNNRELAFGNNLSETVTNFNLVQQRFDALLSNPPK